MTRKSFAGKVAGQTYSDPQAFETAARQSADGFRYTGPIIAPQRYVRRRKDFRPSGITLGAEVTGRGTPGLPVWGMTLQHVTGQVWARPAERGKFWWVVDQYGQAWHVHEDNMMTVGQCDAPSLFPLEEVSA